MTATFINIILKQMEVSMNDQARDLGPTVSVLVTLLNIAERQPDKEHILIVIRDAVAMARMVEVGLLSRDENNKPPAISD